MAGEWSRAGEDDSFLLRGARLENFEAWIAGTSLAVTPEERQFLGASTAEHEREIETERRRLEEKEYLENRARRVLQGLVAVFLIAAIIAGGLALWANSQRARAITAEGEARRQASIGLAAQAVAELDGDSPERGVLLALETLEKYPYTPQAENALAQTVYATVPYRELTVTDGAATTRATAFSPDGIKIVSVSAEYDAVVWDVATGQDEIIGNEYPSSDERRAYIDVDWSPDGLYFVVVAGTNINTAVDAGMIKIWQLPDERNVASWLGHEGSDIYAVDWSSGGELIVTGGNDNLARVWRAGDWEEVQAFAGHRDTLLDVALSPQDKYLATASADTTVRLWDMERGEELKVLSGHLAAVNAVAWSPDGSRLISAADDGQAIIWDAATGEIQEILAGHTDAVRYVAWSPDGALVATASADGTTRVRDLATNALLMTIQGTGRGLSWSPDGTHLAVGVGQGTLRLWTIPQQPLRLVGHENALIDGKWTPDGSQIVTTAFDGTARVWDALSGDLERTFTNHQEVENALVAEIAISPDSQWVATTGTDNYVRVWNVETGKERLTFSDMNGARAFSPDGTRLAIIADTRGLILDTEKDTILHDFSPRYGAGGCFSIRMAWSPDSRYFVVPCLFEPRADIWNAETGEHLMTLAHDDVGVTASAWSADGFEILTADLAGHLHFWDSRTGDPLQTLVADTSVAWDVEFSPDGSRIATGGDSGQVRIWDLANREVVNSYSAGFSLLNVHWSPDGTQLLATGIRPIPDIRPVWQSTKDLVAHARECCVFRELTADERQQFGLPEKP